jgi:acid stress-induced BolA-like protein IbaG/YrbA
MKSAGHEMKCLVSLFKRLDRNYFVRIVINNMFNRRSAVQRFQISKANSMNWIEDLLLNIATDTFWPNDRYQWSE